MTPKIYTIIIRGEPERLVRAKSRAAALAHVHDEFGAEVATQEDLVQLAAAGVKVEDAAAAAAAARDE